MAEKLLYLVRVLGYLPAVIPIGPREPEFGSRRHQATDGLPSSHRHNIQASSAPTASVVRVSSAAGRLAQGDLSPAISSWFEAASIKRGFWGAGSHGQRFSDRGPFPCAGPGGGWERTRGGEGLVERESVTEEPTVRKALTVATGFVVATVRLLRWQVLGL
jgi:hypothetical protein